MDTVFHNQVEIGGMTVKTARPAVIFDMDGVLFDSESVYIEGYVRFASEYPEIRETSLSCIGANGRRTREIFLQKYGEDFPFDAYHQQVKAYVASHPIPLKPYVHEILARCRERGLPTALASSTREESVRRMLGEAGLTAYFDVIICGDMVSHSKPHPEIFLFAAEKLGALPADCYVIEDSYNGIRCAHNAGMHPLMVPDILQPDAQISAMAEAVLPDLNAAMAYLEGQI